MPIGALDTKPMDGPQDVSENAVHDQTGAGAQDSQFNPLKLHQIDKNYGEVFRVTRCRRRCPETGAMVDLEEPEVLQWRPACKINSVVLERPKLKQACRNYTQKYVVVLKNELLKSDERGKEEMSNLHGRQSVVDK